MNFYTCTQDRSYTKWTAMLPKSEARRLHLSEQIAQDSFWEKPQVIEMKMHASLDRTAIVKYADTHAWKHDTRLDMVPPPWANKLILSPRFKNLLAEFEGPEHRLYPVNMSNYHNMGDQEQSYYLLHLRYRHFQSLDYARVTFVVGDPFKDMPRPYKRFEAGEIRSYDEYLRLNEAMQIEFPEGELKPMVWIYDKPWDFLWSTTDDIIVSESVKQRAEQVGLEGVSFELFKDASIVTRTTA